MRVYLACVLLAACSFRSGASLDAKGIDSRVVDSPKLDGSAGSHDAPPDLCFGSQGSGSNTFYLCGSAAPTMPLTLPNATSTMMFDTDTCAGGFKTLLLGQMVCLLDGAGVTVNNFVATGPNPLVVASTMNITINNGQTLDVSSQGGSQHGAGSNPTLTACGVSAAMNGPNNNNGGAGGAGGSFGTAGGSGGSGAQTGGTPNATQTPTSLRAGCPGGTGGNGTGGTGGHQAYGGGAVWIVAYQTINVLGTINASGEHGYHGTQGGGGGGASGGGASGGASGGMILFDAATLMVSGKLVADGGGAGGGGDNANGGDGQDGQNADPNSPQNVAPRGGGGGQGGAGGSGAATNNSTVSAAGSGNAGANNSGGGGGGGGEGVIWVIKAAVPGATNTISPNAAAAP